MPNVHYSPQYVSIYPSMCSHKETGFAFGPLPVSPIVICSSRVTWVCLSPIYGDWEGGVKRGKKKCEKGSLEQSEQWRVHCAGDCGGERQGNDSDRVVDVMEIFGP